MGAFDKVIGYEHIKDELLQVCDMIRNREVYEKLGAKLPRGILLQGDPGLGKTLMANCFMEECCLTPYIIRRTKGKEDFVTHITEIFREAKENAPAVILLDDLDKFANEDENHQNAEEYVAVQSGIDEVKGYDVLVIATANETKNMPDSLLRAGRFDRLYRVNYPTEGDAFALLKHFLSDKPVSSKINTEDLSKMMASVSCAELESLLNSAAILAASKRKESIEMEDMVEPILQAEYGLAPINHNEQFAEQTKKVALHEAGHLVIAEVLDPGCIGLVSVRVNNFEGEVQGFVRRCKSNTNRRKEILITLAGKVATELYYSETCASGCSGDLRRAKKVIYEGITESGTCGVGFLCDAPRYGATESLHAQREATVYAEMERYMFKVRDILLKNRAFLEKAAEALAEKETLLYSDIRKIRESVEVVTNEQN